jgi:hypothetical protein
MTDSLKCEVCGLPLDHSNCLHGEGEGSFVHHICHLQRLNSKLTNEYIRLGGELHDRDLEIKKLKETIKKMKIDMLSAIRLADLSTYDCCSYHADAIIELKKSLIDFEITKKETNER